MSDSSFARATCVSHRRMGMHFRARCAASRQRENHIARRMGSSVRRADECSRVTWYPASSLTRSHTACPPAQRRTRERGCDLGACCALRTCARRALSRGNAQRDRVTTMASDQALFSWIRRLRHHRIWYVVSATPLKRPRHDHFRARYERRRVALSALRSAVGAVRGYVNTNNSNHGCRHRN